MGKVKMEYTVRIDTASRRIVQIQCHIHGVHQDKLLFRLGEKSFRFEGTEAFPIDDLLKKLSEFSPFGK